VDGPSADGPRRVIARKGWLGFLPRMRAAVRPVKPVWALLLLLACGPSTDPPHTSGELDSVDLSPAPGWPGAVEVRSVPGSFRTTITTLEVDPREKVWLLRDEVSDPSQLLGAPVLERYGATGHLERRIGFASDSRVSSFVVHPSGELSVFVMRGDPGGQQYDLEIVRLTAEGERLATTPFEEVPGPRENLYYDETGVHALPVNGPFKLGWTSHVEGVADGEGLYLLVEWSYGFKLYRLDGSNRRLWGRQVMPANVGMAFQLSPSLIVRDGDAVDVATQIFEEDLHFYGEHFGRAPLTPLGSYDVLVQRFEADGTFAGARLFGGPTVDHPSAMTARDGVVVVAGAARTTKFDTPNRTMEWDIAVMRGRVEGVAPPEYRTIDLARDDFGWALAETPGGGLIVGGRTDYVQVDTNSEVENGKGLLLVLQPDLTEQSVVELPMPRDVQVHALRMLSNGRLVFAGTRDGPLTHTERSMTRNDGFWGVARVGP